MPKPRLNLKGFAFKELFQPEKLQSLDQQFLAYLKAEDELLYQGLLAYRLNTLRFSGKQLSEFLIACARVLEQFITYLFDIEPEVIQLQKQILKHNPIFLFKQWYVQREAKRRLQKQEQCDDFESLDLWLNQMLVEHQFEIADFELAVASLGQKFLENEQLYQKEIDLLINWCVQALVDPKGQKKVQHWVSFKLPNKIDYFNLVPMKLAPNDSLGRFEALPQSLRQRDGFKLTDPRMSEREVLNEVHYCVYCHKNEGDYCSKGFLLKKNEPKQGFKKNPLGDTLTGCPLEEKISEMHLLKKEGQNIATLAMIMADNPMCPVTGHRICNDCMKACIYQKQDPVNIPQTETGALTDILTLPWGVEIYDLLTRWNPLRQTQYLMKPYNGLKVLIMGMGPAGFSLAHHLTLEGFAVVGVDGLKIEPLPEKYLSEPIYSYDEITEQLDSRIMAGFGGVAEYGITVRWDKNFLKLIYITLSRRPHFQVFGGVRFGGTLKVSDAWKLGFNHMAIAVGAGLPKELNIPGSLAIGMRQANDFLMALQLTGAAKKTSLANLQVRLPAVVIGGGLTGVDTATEVQAYYIAQVEKTLERYEKLASSLSDATIKEHFPDYTLDIFNEFLAHGKEVKAERLLAAKENREPDFIKLLRAWGGVSIVYRRLLRESPAYTRNHEEVTKAMEEGIFYLEGLEPICARLDKYGHVSALVCNSWKSNDKETVIPAKSIFVATGARPNIAYEFEHRGTFHRVNQEYQTYENKDGQLAAVHPIGDCKIDDFGPFTSYQTDGFRVTFLGDTHPIFHGSVVKAIASAKRIYPKILECLGDRINGTGSAKEYQDFATKMDELFKASIKKIKRHTPSVIELEIHAPMATKNFQPGEFYRVQNFESYAPLIEHTRLQSEAVAMLGSKVDPEKGNISLMVLEKGASSRLFATFKEGDPISIMGPTGVRTKIPQNETVLIIGGGMSVAYLAAVGPTLREHGNRVLYVAQFETADEVYCQDELEAAADAIVWVTRQGPLIKSRRVQDVAVMGETITILERYAEGSLKAAYKAEISLQSLDRVHIVGTHDLAKQIQSARHQSLKNYFIKNPIFIASIYGPMQCMLKGVCAQCLQWQIDPVSGKRTKAVFACSWQDQQLEIVDLDNLDERLEQNRTLEILTNLWLDHLFKYNEVARV